VGLFINRYITTNTAICRVLHGVSGHEPTSQYHLWAITTTS